MEKENVIIFGASRLGEIAFNCLKDKYYLCYFTDNDQNKWGKLFCGIKIIPPKKIYSYRSSKVIIASMYYDEISVQLKKEGLDNIYIFSYVDVNNRTYNKKFFVDKMCDLDIYNNLNLDLNFKREFVNNYSLIYSDGFDLRKEKINKPRGVNRNVLIIAYFFPPVGGSGVQRTLKYVKYLKRYGWNPIVLTVGEDYCPYDKDFSLLNEIPNDVKVYRIDHNYINSEQLNSDTAQQIVNLIYGVIDDENIAREYLLRIKENQSSGRRNILEPDQYISWANSVLQDIEGILEINAIDLVYTTSAPYSNNPIGYYLKKKYNIPWVIDFRDEWTNNAFAEYFYKGDFRRWNLHRNMEKNMVEFADKIITVTPVSSENYRNMFNLPYDKVIAIANGYDEEDFSHILNHGNTKQKYSILHYGSLYLNRLPENVILALNQLIEEGSINRGSIEINFIGKIDTNLINSLYLLDHYKIVLYTDYLPHLECLVEASKSNLLLLAVGREETTKEVYTGKIFEYLRLRIPILALSPKGSLVEELLGDTNSGRNFDYIDLPGIKDYILKQYKKWLLGENDFNVNEKKIQEFERKSLTRRLSEVFNSLM